MGKLIGLLNGPQTLGRGKGFWSGFVLVCVAAAFLPTYVEDFTVNNVSYFLIWVFMALSLSLL